jgi:hypothetical protein
MNVEYENEKETDDDIQQGFPFDVEGDVLDDYSRRDNLIVVSLSGSGGCSDLRCWWGTSSGRKVGVVVRRERPVIWDDYWIIQPLLQ